MHVVAFVFRVTPPYPVVCVIDRSCCASFRLTLAVAFLFALDRSCCQLSRAQARYAQFIWKVAKFRCINILVGEVRPTKFFEREIFLTNVLLHENIQIYGTAHTSCMAVSYTV